MLAAVLAAPTSAAPESKRIAATDPSQRASLTLTPEAFRRHGPITLLAQHLVAQVVDAFETLGQRFLTAALRSVSTTFQDALNRLFGDLTQDVQLRDAAITPQGQSLQLWLPTPPPHRLNPRLGLRLSEDRATSVPSPRRTSEDHRHTSA